MQETKMNTGRVRLSFVTVNEPKAMGEGSKPKYSCVLLIPKNDTATIQAIQQCMGAALANDREGANKLKGIQQPKHPLHDGDGVRPSDNQPYGDECKGHYVMTASSYNKPGLVDVNLNILPEPTEWYSGIYARANINFYCYSTNGNKGIACGLNHLQKLSDGEPLAGAGSATSAFDDGYVDPNSVIEGGDPVLDGMDPNSFSILN